MRKFVAEPTHSNVEIIDNGLDVVYNKHINVNNPQSGIVSYDQNSKGSEYPNA